jgi:vacuolar-type H+-ATPase subunit I/STV1
LLPHAKDLDKWIIERTKALGGQISMPAAGELAMRLGRDQAKETKVGGKLIAAEEVYSLWRADSEIKKLMAYKGFPNLSPSQSGGEGRGEVGTKAIPIEPEDVRELVAENLEVDAFQITNAIADKLKQEAFLLINKFLKDQNASDEKGGVIQLNALLSEQFRNVAMVQDFLSHKTDDEEILRQTAWKSGRLYIMKKIAERFQPKKVLETLNKLGAMDEELKTTQTPPRMLLDLILAQII